MALVLSVVCSRSRDRAQDLRFKSLKMDSTSKLQGFCIHGRIDLLYSIQVHKEVFDEMRLGIKQEVSLKLEYISPQKKCRVLYKRF